MPTMTLEELSKLERDIQLGDPEKVKLPDGRTVAEARKQNDEAAAKEGKATAARQEAADKARLSEPMDVRVLGNGQIASSPVSKPVVAPAPPVVAPPTAPAVVETPAPK